MPDQQHVTFGQLAQRMQQLSDQYGTDTRIDNWSGSLTVQGQSININDIVTGNLNDLPQLS